MYVSPRPRRVSVKRILPMIHVCPDQAGAGIQVQTLGMEEAGTGALGMEEAGIMEDGAGEHGLEIRDASGAGEHGAMGCGPEEAVAEV